MAVSIEDILLARSYADQENRLDTEESVILGAGIAGTAGISFGDLAHRMNPTQMSTMPPNVGARLKPGKRMAGGLVGAILGGALGAGASQMMQQQSPAASILAKLQTQGELNAVDQQALQNILADTYSNTLGI
jgi:ABC-type lipoprotein release transport system permease subunit